MRILPVLFNADMVRAILDGRKGKMKSRKNFTKHIVGSRKFSVDVSDSGEFTVNIQDCRNFTVNISDCRGYSINQQDSAPHERS